MRGFNQYQGAKQELEIKSLDIVPSKEILNARRQESQNYFTILQETCETGKTEENVTLVFGSGMEEGLEKAESVTQQKQSFDYQKVKWVLQEIKEYISYPQFSNIYGKNADNILRLVDNILDGVERQEAAGLIRKSLHILKNITAGAPDTMIGAGISALLGSLPV